MASRVLEIRSQFSYLPSCMFIAFEDEVTHRTDMQIVRAPPGVDLSKLKEAHDIYKDVLHDQLDLEEAISLLDKVMKKEPRYGPWVVILMYGLASASVGPFAFKAGWVDLPIAFCLGIFVGWFQITIVPRSDMYSNVSEVSIAIVTSFIARVFGSMRGGSIFCFPALAQSSIVLILPGYTLRKWILPCDLSVALSDYPLSLRVSRAPIEEFRGRVCPHCVRADLFAFSRFWNPRWNRSVWHDGP